MGPLILRGITTALLVTVLTLFAGIIWGITGLGGLSISRLLDIGLLASCLVGGYRTAKESGEWLLGGIVGVGYVTVGTLLLALFLPIRGWGFIQVLAEGAIIGLVAGAVGAGGAKGPGMSAWSGKKSQFTPSYAGYETDYGYETNDSVSSTFDWDKEEEHEGWKEAPLTNWIESSEGDLKGTHGAKRDCGKSPDVQWPWDREEEKYLDSGPRQLEPLVGWEPESARTDLVERNRASFSKNIVGDKRPWWE